MNGLLGALFAAFIIAMLIENVLLSQILGVCSFLGISKKMENAFGMGAAVVVVMFVSTAITYPLYKFVLAPLGIAFLDTIAFILVIASVVQLLEMVLKRFFEGLYRGLGVFLPLITTNCAVLGIALNVLNPNLASNFLQALVVALGSAVGYALVLIAFSAIRIKLDSKDVPKAFKGLPIAFITAALMSIAFLGFQGFFGG